MRVDAPSSSTVVALSNENQAHQENDKPTLEINPLISLPLCHAQKFEEQNQFKSCSSIMGLPIFEELVDTKKFFQNRKSNSSIIKPKITLRKPKCMQ